MQIKVLVYFGVVVKRAYNVFWETVGKIWEPVLSLKATLKTVGRF